MTSFSSDRGSSLQTLTIAIFVGALAGGVSAMVVPRLTLPKTVLAPAQTLTPELFVAGSEEEQVLRVVARALPSVVAVSITKEVAIPSSRDPFFNDLLEEAPPTTRRERIGGGSGFFVSEDGLLVTNRHVVADPLADYSIITQDGKRHTAKILDVDPSFDLAILRVEDISGITPLELGDSDALKVGQTVLAIGNALAEFQNSVTKGIVSGKNRRIIAGGGGSTELIEEAIQTDAAINPGNSGGPLLDLRGKVIGVNTAVSRNGQSLAFAIPAHVVRRAVESVKKTGKIVRPWLGVRYFMIDEDAAKRDRLPVTYGAFISRGSASRDAAVVPNSPADKAGIQENDIILEIGDKKLTNEHSLASALGAYLPGEEVRVKILRRGEEKLLTLKLEERK